jgi:protoporphyrinogen/coproporphyrinogen III oxidase
MSPELAENLSFMQVNKILLGYDRVADSKAHTVQVPSVEDDEILCIFLDHNKAPDRAPKGHSLMDIQTDLRFFEKTTTMSDDDLIAWARGKVEKFFPELAGHFDGMSHVQRWPRLGNMNSPGYYANVAKLLDRLDPNSRIQVGGDLFTKAYQDGAATWGKIAAENLIKALA